MKTQLFMIVGLMSIGVSAFGQVSMPEATISVHVVDEAGQPVMGAKVGIEDDVFGRPPSGGGVSDENGLHTGTLRTWGSLFYGAQMDGYYAAGGEYQFDLGAMGKDTSQWGTSKWSPHNPTVRIVLTKKGDTIPMYAKRIIIAPPVLDGTPVGFDFIAGDWTAPHGLGKTTDIIFSATGSIEESNLNLEWSFPNKADGIRVYTFEGGARSELRSPKQAPDEGYVPTITVDAEGRPWGQTGVSSRPLSFVFRVRTVVDENGTVISAHYGKIYPEAYNMVYYFNPTANSRTLEYDLKQNLFKNVKSYERVNEP